MKFDVVPAHENFRGLSYGDWAAVWTSWLLSEDPDNSTRKDILYLRGNLDYKPVGSDNNSPRFLDPNSSLMRCEENAERIFEKTAILVPVLTATYSIGDIYEGKRLYSECELRNAVNRDTDESLAIWARIAYGKRVFRIVDDLNDYRIESPLFKLTIPTNSRLRLKAQTMADPGTYDTVVGGFFLILRSLPSGKHRLEFGGKGRGNYGTNSIYDILVGGARNYCVTDNTI